jgi:hypothetical protein
MIEGLRRVMQVFELTWMMGEVLVLSTESLSLSQAISTGRARVFSLAISSCTDSILTDFPQLVLIPELSYASSFSRTHLYRLLRTRQRSLTSSQSLQS